MSHEFVKRSPTRDERDSRKWPDRVRGSRFLQVAGGARFRGILWLRPVKGSACSVPGVSSRCFVGPAVFPGALLGLHGRASRPPQTIKHAPPATWQPPPSPPGAARKSLCRRRCVTFCAGVMLRSVSFRYPRGVLRSGAVYLCIYVGVMCFFCRGCRWSASARAMCWGAEGRGRGWTYAVQHRRRGRCWSLN